MALSHLPFRMGLYAATLPLKMAGKATKLTLAMVIPILMMRAFRWMMKGSQYSSKAARHTASRSAGPRRGTYRMAGEEEF